MNLGETKQTKIHKTCVERRSYAVSVGSEVDTAQAFEANVTMAQKKCFRLHPVIGIARMGDSGAGLSNPFIEPGTFYLAPTTTGGLPTGYT